MYSLLQIIVKKIETTIDLIASKDFVDHSRRLFIGFLNTIKSQQENSSTRAISYFLKYPRYLTNYNFTCIPWYSLSFWIHEQEQSVHSKIQSYEEHVTYETFKLHKSKLDDNIMFHNFRIATNIGHCP
jgi:hypothetical protein